MSNSSTMELLLREVRDRETQPGRTIEITCGVREHVDPKNRAVVEGTEVFYAEVRTGLTAHVKGFGDTMEDALASALKNYRDTRDS